MFSNTPNYTKLKTHLRLALNRLKLLEKKKTELTQKARKEIADYIQIGKNERAKIRVEHIIREDYLVEAMEIVEMFCDLLLARFGLITQMKALDEGIAEAVASLIWVAPRLQSDVQELKVIGDLLTAKYGKQYAEACRVESVHISEKLKHKLSIQAPPKLLVEKYMIEIARNYDLDYEPDPEIMKGDVGADALLIDFSDKNNLGGGGGGMPYPQPAGFIGFPPLPPQPQDNAPYIPFNYPQSTSGNIPSDDQQRAGYDPGPTAPIPSMPYGAPFSYNIPPGNEKVNNTDPTNNLNPMNPPAYNTVSPDDNLQDKPKPQPRSKLPGGEGFSELPDLPNVPSDTLTTHSQGGFNDDIDFDDLTRRFEELKKKK